MQIIKALTLVLLMSGMASCHVARYFYWNYADVKDYKKFPSVPVHHGSKKVYIIQSNKNEGLVLPDAFISDKNFSFDSFLEKKKTNAFLILKDDTIVYKQYFNGFNDSSVCPSFSVSKVFVSALAGIAITEGKINSIHASIGEYFPEFSGKEIGKVSVENLLNMRSGISFSETYGSPFSSMAKYYYGRHLLKYTKYLGLAFKPDSAYDYISVNTLLLGQVIERATGKKLNEYLEEKIWQTAGMNYDASWSIDSKKHKTIKSFCCLNVRPIDYVIFGNLYLHHGWRNNTLIIPEEWIDSSTVIINNSKDSQGYSYTYHWRVLPDGSYFAKGVLGQYIFIDPIKKIVIVRLGSGYCDVNWIDLFQKIAKQL